MAEVTAKRFSAGYALLQKKQRSFVQCSLLNSAKERGIDLIRIDTDKPLIDQGPFDCVLHKLNTEDWRKQLKEYSVRNPSAYIIDSPDAIQRLHNRISMLEVVSEIEAAEVKDGESASFGTPKQTVIYESEKLKDTTCWGEELKFPVIAKPLVADGRVREPRRGDLQSVCGRRVSNMTSHPKNDDIYYKILEDAEMPPMSLITNIARGLRKAMKLHLFNFDVIRDTRIGNRYLVVDINYFPGYAKMPGYESVLTDFLWDVLTKEEARSFNNKKETTKLVEKIDFCGDQKGSLPVLSVEKDEQGPFQV
ncbi:unnamed protein product [Lactuca virosa]|uniref:Inositol-tetrakisphosphate 1-kinase n=1 Tax=Lactuca virosa TaxID=75947 RepID=A0AAU9PW85_9ASTR|nr:unnamed protein product [Lactuca virosa]